MYGFVIRGGRLPVDIKRTRTEGYLLVTVAFVVGTGLGYLIAYLSGVQPSIVPLVSAVLGLLVAFSVPLWQALFVNAPKLSVEITAIKRIVSNAAIVSIEDDPELLPLRDPTTRPPPWEPPSERRPTLSNLEELLLRAQQRMEELPNQIEERRKEMERVNALTPTALSKYEAAQLNAPLHPEIEFDVGAPEKTLEQFRAVYQQRLEESEKRYKDLQLNLPSAERKVELIKEELMDSSSFFTVSASLINSGRSNTAIKVPALLRVSIGEGNYIDLKLVLKDFENKSEISASSTRIVVFESPEMSSFPEEDRKLINTYWGQSVSSRLLLEDIHSKIYTSNAIAFAEGLYQKLIYDRLARAASAEQPHR
jgi:hypothetical protein